MQRLKKINAWRQKLYSFGLIGADSTGVGYGNISMRLETTQQFIITGSGTGVLPFLDEKHYTTVVAFDVEKNSLICEGPIVASSESLTHGSLYCIDQTIRAVIHVHHHHAWKALMHRVPTTTPSVAYGTPAMAHEMSRLCKESDLLHKKILVMGGHEGGLISLGKDLDEAGNILLKYISFKKIY